MGALFVIVAITLSHSASATVVVHNFDFRGQYTTSVASQPLVITSDNGLDADLTGTGNTTDGRLKRNPTTGIGIFDEYVGNGEKLSVTIPVVGVLIGSVVFEAGAGASGLLDIYVDSVFKETWKTTVSGGSDTIDFSTKNYSGSLFEFVGRNDSPGSASYSITSLSLSVGNGIPEPATLALMGLGIAGIGYKRRKQTKAA